MALDTWSDRKLGPRTKAMCGGGSNELRRSGGTMELSVGSRRAQKPRGLRAREFESQEQSSRAARVPGGRLTGGI